MRVRAIVGGLIGSIGFLGGTPLPAQTALVSVHGVAFDSLRAVALPDAFIRLSDGRAVARTTTSDARGEFRFDSVAPGAYTVSMLHAALDSIGFSGISVRTAIGPAGGDAAVQLSIPSFATLWRAACGAGAAPADSGFVFGTLRDAELRRPLPNARVTVRWISVGIDSGQGNGARPRIAEQAWGGEASSDSTGGYVLCGVPSDTPLRVLARTDSLATGVIELLPSDDRRPRVQRRDLLLGAVRDSGGRRGAVAGLVHDAVGAPVSGARVITAGAEESRTGADGRFVVPSVPVGTREVEILGVGAQPATVIADITPGDTAVLSVELRKTVTLPAVVVRDKAARQRLLADFEERKALGLGHFLDSTQVAPYHNLQNALSMVLNTVCPLFIDGVQYGERKDIAQELYLRSPLSIAMIETHRADDPSLPAEYRPHGRMKCGGPPPVQVVLVWTKSWLP